MTEIVSVEAIANKRYLILGRKMLLDNEDLGKECRLPINASNHRHSFEIDYPLQYLLGYVRRQQKISIYIYIYIGLLQI
jgi:hypothetical protein